MGKVVDLEAGKQRRTAGAKPKRRPRRSKTALVLGGGGFTGGVYEIGALRALDLLSVNRTVNQFDVYVGHQRRRLRGRRWRANGITPEEMMRVVNRQVPTPFRDIDVGTLLRPNFAEFARSGVQLPLQAGAHRARPRRPARSRLGMDVVLSLAEVAAQRACTRARASRTTCATVLSDPDRTDDFRLLEHELYLAATDLDTCERIVFGANDWDDVPISTAVRASTALPMVYKPVDASRTASSSTAASSRPPTSTSPSRRAPSSWSWSTRSSPTSTTSPTRVRTLSAARARHVSDMGFPQIGYQSFKLLAYQRLHEMARQWEQRYPGVDIVLIEPEPNDELMFQTSIMNFTRRVEIARHGFESVTLKLAEDYDELREVCERHGIEISATRVRKVVKHFAAEKERTRAWRKILEQTTGALLRQSGGD